MIESAVTDIISPTVAADDPDTLLDKIISQGEQVAGTRVIDLFSLTFRSSTSFRCWAIPASVVWSVAEDGIDKFFADLGFQSPAAVRGHLQVFIQGQAHAQTKFRIVFKQ